MAALIETMAYTSDVPWHGLGFTLTNPKSTKQSLKDAKLDWRVERRPMMFGSYDEDGAPQFMRKEDALVPDFAALVRNTDGKVLDVVGSRYIPTQNKDVFEFVREFVDAGKGTVETAGSLRGGKIVWVLISLNSSFTLKGGDTVKGYLLVASPHEQGKSLIIKFTTIRVVCNNTLTLALKRDGTEWRMNHRNEFDAEAFAEAKEALGIARDQLGDFERNARLLQKIKLTEKDAINILAPTFAPQVDVADLLKDPENLTGRLEVLLDINKRAPGAEPGTAWGLLNAVTYYADHVASRTPDRRLSNAWLGRTAQHKEVVLEKLLELA